MACEQFRRRAQGEPVAALRISGVSFQLTGRKSYGRAESLDEAKTAFRAEYLAWKGTEKDRTG
jgi:hypothetical protein